MKLNQLLAEGRARKKITLRALEAKIGISNAVISQIETGYIVEPSFRNVVKIAKALEIPMSKLFDTE